jgi:peptidoglycan DL-endopeptidase CwlO
VTWARTFRNLIEPCGRLPSTEDGDARRRRTRPVGGANRTHRRVWRVPSLAVDENGETPDVASHRLKRTMLGALAATAVAASLGLVTTPASADPTQQLNDLSQQAQALNEQVHRAQDALTTKQKDLSQANAAAADASAAAADARNREAGYRTQVDQLTSASFQGAQLSQLSALLTSRSTQQYLDQSSMLDLLARQNNQALTDLSSVVAQTAAADKATQAAQQHAQQATDEAAKINDDLQQRQKDLKAQTAKVRAQVDQLGVAAQAARANAAGTITSASAVGSFVAPPGIRGAAMQSALSQVGKPYVWGGASPSVGFDCSGLVLWAYAQQGVSLPHSAQAQMAMGQSVPRDALEAGDLVFFGTASNIHHMGLYVGNGQMVNASDFGIPVRVQSAWQSDYFGARRLGA